ncbi:MAG TPA: hypothetical protein VFI06_17550 [Chitinophagaceae bacterium]|nr:hypothetical protein [Chitinophagaceae bacterium]
METSKHHNELTVFINNFSDGWVTLLNNYSIEYDREITMATLSDQSTVYPIYRFYHRDKFNERFIQTLKEVNSWEFYQRGQPLSIEDESNYNKRRIVDRLNNSIIENYMQKLGFDYTKKEFWLSKGEAIEYTFVLGVS